MSLEQEQLNWLASAEVLSTLCSMARGIEREALRVTPQGTIAQTPHPKSLGSTLCHTSITTDYSEALLELITVPHSKIQDCLEELNQLHGFVVSNLDNEYLWPLSMPPAIHSENEIPIAQYGSSAVGLMKHIYRRGLGARYGRKMQSIAGIHYNLSFPDTFWSLYQARFSQELTLRECKDRAYFKIVRQFLRDGWMLILLTGASPACHQSFISNEQAVEKKLVPQDDFFFGAHATSLRMGGLGYHNPAQADLFVCYDSLEQYVHTLSKALSTPDQDYQEKGLHDSQGKRQQLTTNVLQIENEFYGSIRPKQVAQSLERPTLALERSGVAYVEIRNIDIDPEAPSGISDITAAMVEIFVTGCLLNSDGLLSRKETQLNAQRNEEAATNGRLPQELLAQALEHWKNLKGIATTLTKAHDDDLYERAYQQGLYQLQNPEELRSARLLKLLKQETSKEGFTKTALDFGKQHLSFFKNSPLAKSVEINLKDQAESSLNNFSKLAPATEMDLDATLTEYFQDLPQTSRNDCAALADEQEHSLT